ncbi:MAG: DUF1877 family protein [Gemmatimonadales bacterium]
MTIICRTLRIGATQSAALSAGALSLPDAIASSRNHSDMYRYWDGISFLLNRHAPGHVAGSWRTLGDEVAPAADGLPAARLLSPDALRSLAGALVSIEPETLAPHYAAAALDAAGIYPDCWQRWEETFDPLGQLLEHYHFLKQVCTGGSAAGDALLLVFEDDGDLPIYDDD